MPTLLVTKKMSPALAERVQASVTGRLSTQRARLAPRTRSLLRIGLFGVLLVLVAWLALSFRHFRHDTEARRGALLARLANDTSGVQGADLQIPKQISTWLVKASDAYAGDLISPGLRVPGAFDSVLSRPAVYVRGPIADFKSRATIADSAEGSFVDTLVLCLVSPPKERTQKALRAKARTALFSDSADMKRTRHVSRLFDMLAGAPFFEPAWANQVRSSRSREELVEWNQHLNRAPMAAARRAFKARLLLVAMDEPGDPAAPAELDGERPHQVRVGVVDLASNKELLRLRRKVDPSWLSTSTRAEFARGVDDCSLALDVRKAVEAEADGKAH